MTLLSSVSLLLQYQYRPGTISEYISDLLAKHAKRRRSRLQGHPLLLLTLKSLLTPRLVFLRLADFAMLSTHRMGTSQAPLPNFCTRMCTAERLPVRVYMDGCFDVMHYGHDNALRQARALGDQLVLGLISDDEIRRAKGPPVLDYKERKTLVGANKWVDEVIDGALCMSSYSMAHRKCSKEASAKPQLTE